MRYALPSSVVIHVALIGGAWLALNWAPPAQETGVESVSVDIVSLEEFTSIQASTVQSSATETLVAAGAKAVEETETVEPVEAEALQTPAAETIETAEPSQPVEAVAAAAESVDPVETASLAVLAAAPTPDAAPVEGLLPLVAKPSANDVTNAAPANVEPIKLASIEPQTAKAAEPEALEPIEEVVPDLVAPKPLPRPTFEAKPKVAEALKPKPERPTETKPEKEKPTRKKPAAKGGDGGQADATVAASAPSGGKGKSDAAGNASANKYPGLVQRALRRALRFPKGAGSARGEVQVTFVVSSSGSASQISVTKSSGHPVLDKEALATVKRAAPFPPIPEGAGRKSWTFTMPLAFAR